MASNLACVGLGVDGDEALERLLAHVLTAAALVGRGDDVDVLRWEDPSGARLVLGVHDGELVELLPSFASAPGARLAAIEPVNEEVVTAAVVDETGEQVTSLALELEERRLLQGSAVAGPVEASVVALGVAVQVFADEVAFADSPGSLLVDDGSDPGDPPAFYAERGWSWPARVGPESFFSLGVFGPGTDAQAYARLSGSVLRSDLRTVEHTGLSFIRSRVRTAGFDADLCFPPLADNADVPPPGSIISGTVFLVGSIGTASAVSRLRPWRRALTGVRRGRSPRRRARSSSWWT